MFGVSSDRLQGLGSPLLGRVRDFEPRFSPALARKDLGLAQELARATDTPMPLGALAARLRGDPERSSARDTSLIDVNCVAAQSVQKAFASLSAYQLQSQI